MKCPHCLTDFHHSEQRHHIETDQDGAWGYGHCRCSACRRIIIRLFSAKTYSPNTRLWSADTSSRLIRPKASGRPPLPADVPADYSLDYTDACSVLADSAKASAALSRRCLQHLLREKVAVKPQDLAREIQDVLDSRQLPSHIADSLDAIRNIGNFAAHPMKSQSTGEIVDVEPGEAEWNLDVLEMLFDFYFVGPARTKARRDALDKKLADIGKPPLK